MGGFKFPYLFCRESASDGLRFLFPDVEREREKYPPREDVVVVDGFSSGVETEVVWVRRPFVM